MFFNKNYLFLALAFLSLSSCIHHRELVNFNEGPAFETMAGLAAQQNLLLLQTDDLISITVQSVDPVAIAPFNYAGIPEPGQNTAPNTVSAVAQPNYLIDASGEINFPMLGKIKLAGLSTQQARDTLTAKIARYATNPIVNVRLQNFRFTVTGEVGHPGTFSTSGERINLLQALGMAGDISTYGDRSRVLVMREQNGQQEFVYLNLHQRDIFKSPYFYLRQNDIVYVEPMPAKAGATADRSNKILQWVLPVVTVVSIVVSLTK